MNCAGSSTQTCGGSKAIALYQKCSGGTCSNAGSASTPVDVGTSKAVSSPPPATVATPKESKTSVVSHPQSSVVPHSATTLKSVAVPQTTPMMCVMSNAVV